MKCWKISLINHSWVRKIESEIETCMLNVRRINSNRKISLANDEIEWLIAIERDIWCIRNMRNGIRWLGTQVQCHTIRNPQSAPHTWITKANSLNSSCKNECNIYYDRVKVKRFQSNHITSITSYAFALFTALQHCCLDELTEKRKCVSRICRSISKFYSGGLSVCVFVCMATVKHRNALQNGHESLYVNVWNFSHCEKVTNVGQKWPTNTWEWKIVETSNRSLVKWENEIEHPTSLMMKFKNWNL